MARKIFISYKYGDRNVQKLATSGLLETATARSYVDFLIPTILRSGDHIYKGELDDEPLDQFKDETITSKLKDRIYDSSITLVLISENMRELAKREADQWIPWEVSYSLREKTRDGRTSQPNGFVAVVLPDAAGSYDYFVTPLCSSGCITWQRGNTFAIISQNMFNRKQAKTTTCGNHPVNPVHTGDDHSYIHPVKWSEFILDVNRYLGFADVNRGKIADFDIFKTL